MARQRNPLTGALMIEGVSAVTSERTGTVTFRGRTTYTDGTGKRRFRGQTHKTYDEAVEWKLEMELRIRRGMIGTETAMTVAGYFREWYPRHARQLAASTAHDRERLWTTHLEWRIGHRRLADLKRADLQRLVDVLCEPKPDGAGLKPDSARNVMLIMSGLLKSAVKDGIITTSPGVGIDYPKVSSRQPKTVWTPLQMQRYLAGVRSHYTYPAWLALATTGCRIGEVVAIRVSDVQFPDIEEAPTTLWIRHTFRRVGNTVSYGPGTKSGPGRLVLIPEMLANVLRGLVDGRNANDFLFPGHDGGPIRPRVMQDMLRREYTRQGLPRITPHGFRHSAASMMIVNQVPVSVVQRMLGHRDAQTTLNTYTHLITIDQAIGASTLDRLLGTIPSDTTTRVKIRAKS